jgi:hypothetical protein
MEFTIEFDTNKQAEEFHKRLINRSNKENGAVDIKKDNGAVDIKKDNGQETMQKNDGLVPLKPIGE